MTKRYLFLSLFLGVVCFGTSAQEFTSEYIELPMLTSQGDVRDIMYAEPALDGPMKVREFAGSEGIAGNYKDRITNMPQYLHDFIDAFVEAGNEVLQGGRNWLSDPTMATRGSSSYYYLLKEVTDKVPFSFPVGSTGDVIAEAAKAAFSSVYNDEYDILKSFLPYAFLSLNHDHPEFFWIGNAFNYGAGNSYRYSYSPSQGTGEVEYTINLMFNLCSNSFDIRTNGVSSYDLRNVSNLEKAVSNFNIYKNIIIDLCHGATRYEQVLAAHDRLTHYNCYNYFYYDYGYSQSQIGDTPWSALSAIEGHDDQQAPVCEGYSRAFKVICDELEIPCILISGIVRDGDGQRGGHMWNYVKMEDDNWYVVDVTWDDPSVAYNTDALSGYECHDWFLLGSESPVNGGLTLIQSHPEETYNSYPSKGSRTWDLLPGPQLSPVAYTPAVTPATPIGDVNEDGEIDIADAVSVLNAMAGEEVAGNADVNEDGEVDIADFVAVLNIMAGE